MFEENNIIIIRKAIHTQSFAATMEKREHKKERKKEKESKREREREKERERERERVKKGKRKSYVIFKSEFFAYMNN